MNIIELIQGDTRSLDYGSYPRLKDYFATRRISPQNWAASTGALSVPPGSRQKGNFQFRVEDLVLRFKIPRQSHQAMQRVKTNDGTGEGRMWNDSTVNLIQLFMYFAPTLTTLDPM